MKSAIDDAEPVELGVPEFIDTGVVCVNGLLLTGVE